MLDNGNDHIFIFLFIHKIRKGLFSASFFFYLILSFAGEGK